MFINNQTKIDFYGSIYFETEKEFYYPGEIIKGKVFLNLIDEFPSNMIFIKIKGKEQTEFKNNEGFYNKGLIIFYNHRLPLYSSKNEENINAGQYEFPFAIPISSYLPGTFSCKTMYFN